MKQLEFLADHNHNTLRLDVFLAEIQSEFSRSRLKKLIEQGHALVNDFPSQAKYKLKSGDKITLNIPELSASKILAEKISLKIIYEDHILYFPKPL